MARKETWRDKTKRGRRGKSYDGREEGGQLLAAGPFQTQQG